MRWVIARVFPVPAPAITHTGPRVASATARCSESSAARMESSTAMFLRQERSHLTNVQSSCAQQKLWVAIRVNHLA